MSRTNSSEVPFGMELGGIRIGGRGSRQAIASVQAFLGELERPLRAAGIPIHVLLDSSVLEIPGLAPEPRSTAILDLENVELVRFCGRHRGPVRWFSRNDPRGLVGPLLDHYRGTYFRPQTSEIIYSSDFGSEAIPLPRRQDASRPLLAAVCAAREAGVPAQAILSALRKHVSYESFAPTV